MRLSLMMRQSRAWVNMRRNTLIKNEISSSPHDSQETASLNEDIERSSVPEDRTSPTPPSQVWICQAVHFFVHIPSSYNGVAIHKSCVRQYHASTNLEVRISLLVLVCLLDKAKSKRTKARNDGGPLEQPKQMISADSPATRTAVLVPNLISPTPQPKVLALTWQSVIWLHVAYGA